MLSLTHLTCFWKPIATSRPATRLDRDFFGVRGSSSVPFVLPSEDEAAALSWWDWLMLRLCSQKNTEPLPYPYSVWARLRGHRKYTPSREEKLKTQRDLKGNDAIMVYARALSF